VCNLDSGYLAGELRSRGKYINELEATVQDLFNVKHAIAVNSGTSGLWCAVAALTQNMLCRLGSFLHGEVIVTGFSMSASAIIPLHFGLKPVFADIEPDYFCLDVNSIAAKITPKTVGIIVVDLFGMPYDVEAINSLAQKNNLWVVEDAAQAIGAMYKDRYAGTLGDIGVLSFNEHKHISCGEGGMCLTNSTALAHTLRCLMNHAEMKISLPGMNMRLTENAAMKVLGRLKYLPETLNRYVERSSYFFMPVRDNCKSVYYKCHTLQPILKSTHGLKKGYVQPIYQLPIFQKAGYAYSQLPTTEYVAENIWVTEGV
jgi:dTDP-4-amino-4,6-dideoxygalactose transaminase